MFGKKLLNMRRGGVMVMSALAAIFMLGMTALVTDVGYLYYSQSRLQTAVNAGWKAGYDRMLAVAQGRYIPTDAQKAVIEAHIKDVMAENGVTDADAAISIAYTPVVPRQDPGYYLRVESTQTVGLFFAKVMSFAASDVYAMRENHANDLGQGVVPLAIPHGNVGDLSRSTFSFSPFGGNQGFNANGEYILKLGSGAGNFKAPKKKEPKPEDPIDPEEPGPNDPYMLFIPMGTGDQSDSGFLKAYGVIYACLSPSAPDRNVPAFWLLGYRGGAFITKFTTTHKNRLVAAGVNYQGLFTEEEVQAHFDAAGPSVFELFNQRKIAVYSNAASSIMAQTLTEAGITGHVVVNDASVLSGALANYHLVLMPPEDLTGYFGGCSHYTLTCETFFRSGAFGTWNNSGQRQTVANKMCGVCRANYDNTTDTFAAAAAAGCLVKDRRCSERSHQYIGQGNKIETMIWGEKVSNKQELVYPKLICGTSTVTLCTEFIFKSAALGELAPFTTKPHAIQVQKWSAASMIRNHLAAGGYIMAQGLAAETLELALWRKGIVDNVTAYDYCIAFTGMQLATNFPARLNPFIYSDINSVADIANQTFALYKPSAEGETPDPRCQNHVTNPTTGVADTNVFRTAVHKDSVVSLGDKGNGDAKYIKGYFMNGEYCYLGGSIGTSAALKRLVLNNVLYADTCEKVVPGYTPAPLAQRQKGKYGPLDPDNYVGGGANDYRDWFMTGFNQPLQLWDRVILENGNMRGPTDQAVEFRTEGTEEFPPSRHVIVPITDIPPEVAAKQPGVDCVYGLQGNDNPGGLYTPDVASFSSAIRIIGFAEFELLAPDEFSNEDLGPYQPGQVRGKFIRYIIDPREVAGLDPYVTGS